MNRRAIVLVGLSLAACSGGVDERLDSTTSTGVSAPGASSDGSPELTSTEAPPTPSSASSPQRSPQPSPQPSPQLSPQPSVQSSPTSVAAPPIETGVPGLDAADPICAAWSRFAGSFQVIAVAAAFGEGPPEQLAALQVVAAPTVTAAYDELLANWPEVLAAERETVGDAYLGPLARRLAVAEEALVAAGADAATVAVITDAWLAALARRDPTSAEISVDLPDATWDLIDAAASDYASRLVPFGADPSLVVGVATPLTDDYIAANCPDGGTLAGQDVVT